MDEQTTTGVVEEQPSGQDPQLDTTQQTAAETPDGETQPDTASQDEHAAWWANKGLDVKDPDFAQKSADFARKQEQGFHDGQQATKSQLRAEAEKVTGMDDESLNRLAVLETRQAVNDFYAEHPDARQYDEAMGALLRERPHLANDFDSLYALAEREAHRQQLEETAARVRAQTKADIAKASTASTPRGNATAPTSSSETREDQIKETFSNWD